MTYVFINKQNPRRIKMINALSPWDAYRRLRRRLLDEPESGTPADYKFGYYF